MELKWLFDETAKRAASIVRREYPGVIGVLVHGSVARGEPGPFSYVDMLGGTERGLIVLNDISIISENYVWHQVLKAGNRPRHLRDDYPIALGIQGTSDTSKVYRSASRLCKETLRLIRDEFGGRAKHRRFQELLAEPLEKT